MAVVRTHRDADVFSSLSFPPLLLQQERPHDGIHIDVTLQVILFNKIAFRVSRNVPQVNEIDPARKTLRHGRHVIL